jgi:hypothetical protein
MPQALATHHTIVLVDVASFTDPARTLAHQTAVRAGLYMVLKEAFAEARIDWAACYNEDRGDGVMILVPADVPASVLADRLLDRLVAALREHNAMHVAEATIQLRIALHLGQVRQDPAGAVGPALNFAFRLLAAPAAKQALRESTGILAVIASEEFYRDVISQAPATAPESYSHIGVAFDGFSSAAWLRLTGVQVGTGGAEASPAVLGLLSDQELDRVSGWLDGVREPNFAELARKAAGSGIPLPRSADPWQAFTQLVDVNAGADGVPPSLVFLDALAAKVGGEVGGEMTDWIDQKVRQLRVAPAFTARRAAPSHVADDPRLHLLILLDHDAIEPDRYLLSVWRQDDPAEWPPARDDIRDLGPADIERAVDEVVVAAERAWAGQRAAVTLEFLLPRALFHLPVHRWSKEHASGYPQPLCLDYIIRLRSLDRMKSTHWHRAWRERWHSMKADPSSTRIHFESTDNGAGPVDVALRDQDSVAIVFGGAPSERPRGAGVDVLTAALRSGLPVLLWHPEATSEALQEIISWLVEGNGLSGLPERTQESRRAALGSSVLPFNRKLAQDLVVLWDDPDRTVALDHPSNATWA